MASLMIAGLSSVSYSINNTHFIGGRRINSFARDNYDDSPNPKYALSQQDFPFMPRVWSGQKSR